MHKEITLQDKNVLEKTYYKKGILFERGEDREYTIKMLEFWFFFEMIETLK